MGTVFGFTKYLIGEFVYSTEKDSRLPEFRTNMAKIRLTFVLAFIILLSSCTQCSHQTRNTETVRDSSDRNKDLDSHKSSRKGILLEVPIMSISREMTTETILECSGYQADAKNNNNFQVYVYGSWVTQKCHFGLIWNQEKCQCDWNPEIITELEETSQKMCDLTLNITFDDYVVRDYAKNTFIQVDPFVMIKANTKDDRSGINSGQFDPGRLTIHFFAGNSYSDMFQLRIDFKQAKNELNSSQEVNLITNACVIGQNLTEATIALMIISTQQEVSFVVNDHVESAKLNTVSHQWHSLEISFVKGVVHIIDNDQLILNSTAYPAFVDLSQCPLSIGGNPTDAAKSFHGYIDSILLWRQCPANPERNDDLKIQ